LFSRTAQGKHTFILVFVDDLLISGNDDIGITQIKQAVYDAFTIKDLGLARYFLGTEISRSSEGTFLN